MNIHNATAWSEAMFGQTELGDKRLTKRLVKIGHLLSENIGDSVSKSCGGDTAMLEGAYRFIRNESVEAADIAVGGYATTGKLAESHGILLAIEDSTSVVYKHKASKELGYTGNKAEASSRGYLVHSTMLMDAETEKTIGLIAQERWRRPKEEYGKRAQRVKRSYHEKESFKWETNSRQLEQRLGNKLCDTISVCDRDADVYEYMQYKVVSEQRFVIRATHNRRLESDIEKLKEKTQATQPLGSYEITIPQKSNRPKRTATLRLRTSTVTLTPPERRNGEQDRLRPISVNVIYVTEEDSDIKEPLEWLLLTTEPVATFSEARKVTRFYELRWRIEDFHKAWKSGCGVERIRMQSPENIEKMMVILSFVAIRLLQLKEYLEPMPQEKEQVNSENTCCDELLSEIEWKILWSAVEEKPLPSKPPTAHWAYRALAKLGGWTDSKRTGRASWSTLWDGWFRLNEQIKGFLIAQRLLSN